MKEFFRHWPLIILVFIFFSLLSLYIFFNGSISFWAYPDSSNRNGELLKDFLAVSGGLAVLAGLYISFVRSRAMERNVQNQQKQVESQHKQIENQGIEIGLSRESLLNEQFKNAVEHLGSESEPVILGGVAELNFLATSQKEKFAEIVLNIYCSYIKSEANIKKDDDSIKRNVIRAIIGNLCHNKVYEPYSVDLSYTNLTGIPINNCNLSSWNLSYCNLPNRLHLVEFRNSDFSSSKSIISRYVDVKFLHCSMSNLYLENAHWSYPIFSGSTTFTSKCIDSEFRNMFVRDELYSSVFINCEFNHCVFEGKSITSTSFLSCQLDKVSFRTPVTSSLNFNGSSIRKTIFRDFVNRTSFKGVTSNEFSQPLMLKENITASIGKTADLSGISFKGIEGRDNIEGKFTKSEAFLTAKNYNDIINTRSFLKNKVIDIPEDWEEN